MSTSRTRTKDSDEACAGAVALARAAAVELAGAAQVGEHVGMDAEGDRVVTHLFRCLDRAYLGWRWAVTVARASRSKIVTVDECVLLPGPQALLAPDWVPWSERVLPGDLGVGDLMPTSSDDERLVPVAALEGDDGVIGWDPAPWDDRDSDLVASLGLDAADLPGAQGQPGAGQPGDADQPESDQAGAGQAGAGQAEAGQAEAGQADTGQPEKAPGGGPEPAVTGRPRVLSAIGRDAAAIRWYTGDHGPGTPLAHAAPGPCATCGFMVRLAGPLGRVFGVCANEYAPDDGRVVSFDHGCGAHSEAAEAPPSPDAALPVVDEPGYDLVDPIGVSMRDTVFEPLG